MPADYAIHAAVGSQQTCCHLANKIAAMWRTTRSCDRSEEQSTMKKAPGGDANTARWL